MFWICAENSVDITGMALLLLSSAHTEPKPVLILTPVHQRGGWGGAQGVGSRYSWDSWPQATQGISQAKWHHPQHMDLGKGGREDIWNDGICLSKSLLQYDGDAVLEMAEDHSARGKWGMNSLADFACVHNFCFLYEAVYLNSWIFSLLPF